MSSSVRSTHQGHMQTTGEFCQEQGYFFGIKQSQVDRLMVPGWEVEQEEEGKMDQMLPL